MRKRFGSISNATTVGPIPGERAEGAGVVALRFWTLGRSMWLRQQATDFRTEQSGVPSPPMEVTVGNGDTNARISWRVPLIVGKTPVTLYAAAASPGGASCTTSLTEYVVTGLTNGVAYRFTVTASNANGSSPPSSPSEVVVPEPLPSCGGGGGGGGGGGAEPPGDASRSVLRLHGPDRFATAAAVSQRSFGEGVPVVYLATGAQFADALAAGPVASGAGPILRVR